MNNILNHPVIPVVEITDATQAVPLAEAVLAGGVSILEITLRTADGIRAIERVRQHVPDMLVGAGTLSTATQSASVKEAGAQFGVSPGFNREIVESFHAADLPFIPGVMTPTEIEAAMRANCSLLKFFPAHAAGGLPLLKAFSGPYLGQGIRFCATGGITLGNMGSYLELPIVNSIGGSWLATSQQIADGAWTAITQQVQEAISHVPVGEQS